MAHSDFRKYPRRSRRLHYESLEDRRMLTAMTDIVFLVDNSSSDGGITKLWISSIVDELDSTLRDANAIDVQYGVVAYGEDRADLSDRFAHSEVVDTDTSKSVFDRLFSSGTTGQDHVADLQAAIDHVIQVERGGNEDGWDAIDHAIAEYDFRPGAVPQFVLVQNQEGRIAGPGVTGSNYSLTHDGILAALKSKNVILNTLTVSAAGVNSSLFDLAPYGLNSDIRILGVDADAFDGTRDGQHVYHSVDTNTSNGIQQPTATIADTLQISYNGSNTGASGMVATGKSILIGQNISGGIGQTAAGYSAKSVPFEFVNMSNPVNHTLYSAIPEILSIVVF